MNETNDNGSIKDNYLIEFVKNEAKNNIALIPDKDITDRLKKYYDALINFITRGDTECNDGGKHYLTKLIKSLNRILNYCPSYEISLTDDNFIGKNYLYNKHKLAPYIILNIDKSISNINAYHINIKKSFDFINRSTLNDSEYIPNQLPIFISKGGVINGDYIFHTYIKSIDNILVPLPITIPVVKVNIKDKSNELNRIYVVDHREPLLKQLLETYNVPILNNKDIKELKINLRYCTKDIKKIDYDNITFNPVKLTSDNDYRVTEENSRYDLHCKLGIIASIKDGHLTVYYSKIRYKKIDHTYFTWFTGHTLDQLKRILNSNNQNITFV